MQTAKKLRGIFLNPEKANCSIYESGRMIYESLLLSDAYVLDYKELSKTNRTVPGSYDFYAFNYHHVTMGWLNTKFVRKLPGLKITFVLEVAPGNPFVLCPEDDFDAYCVLDPSINILDRRIFPFSRPLEVAHDLQSYLEKPVPVIGSFGFATPGKGFELVVDAVNKEFDKAIVRINIPPGTYADVSTWYLHKQDYAEYLANLCEQRANEGIQVKITRKYMSKHELVEWCRQNTLNCFLYDRNQPGLSATTDQAITSGRPLSVSDNTTFRHIIPYITPYPARSLRESIAVSQTEVLQLQQEWSPENFSREFERLLKQNNIYSASRNKSTSSRTIKLRRKIPKYWYFTKPLNLIRKMAGIAYKT